jgi:hypothetical protein
MKNFWKDFLLRGLTAAAGGPVVLAIIYGIGGVSGAVQTLTPQEVCMGILSITLMAFIAAGITAIYQTERLALPCAIAIHAAVLYADYLIMYLLNSWIPRNATAIGIFTAIFAAGFALVWVVIFCVTKAKAETLNHRISRTK